MDLFIKIYFNKNNIDADESEEDTHFRIGSFRQKLEFDQSYRMKPISKNLEVTEKVRRLIRSNTRLVTMQVVSASGHHFSFESMHLIILTRNG